MEADPGRGGGVDEGCGGLSRLGGRIAQAKEVQQDEDDGDQHEKEGEEVAADTKPPGQGSGAQKKHDGSPNHWGVACDVFRTWGRRVGADGFGSHDFPRFTGTRKFGGAHK